MEKPPDAPQLPPRDRNMEWPCRFPNPIEAVKGSPAATVAGEDFEKHARGCFDAAMFEGWLEALEEGDIDRIRDIWHRRISHVLTPPQPPVAASQSETPRKCPNCKGTDLRWEIDLRNNGGVVDGRLRLNEITPILYLGCEECSETVKVIAGSDVAEKFNTLERELAEERRLNAALTAAKQDSERQWLPIESAPRDNKRMLYLAKIIDGELKEMDFDGIWTSESESWEMPQVYYFWASAYGHVEEPTHWAHQDEPIPKLATKKL